MKSIKPQTETRILTLAPCKRGFGFVVLETRRGLVDWGVKRLAKRTTAEENVAIRSLIQRYAPDRVMKLNRREHKRARTSELCQRVAAAFPELAHHLPKPRRPWEGRNPQMGLLRAAALALSEFKPRKMARDF